MTTPAERLQACLAFTLEYEGGYQARPDDRGNWFDGRLIGTSRGISAPTLAAWMGAERAESLTAQDMRDLPEAEARAIYAGNYWNPIRGDDLPAGIDLMLFDMAVLAGPRRSVMLAQAQLARMLGTITIDGFLGPRTLGAIRAVSARTLAAVLAAAQRQFLAQLAAASANPGWFNRADARLKRAREMMQEAA
jgi:lysozyme family protein